MTKDRYRGCLSRPRRLSCSRRGGQATMLRVPWRPRISESSEAGHTKVDISSKITLLAEIIRWRLRWERRDIRSKPEAAVSGKFVTGREAAALIADRSTVVSCGMAGNARCSAFFWAISEAYAASGHPRELSWISVGAQGGRGRAPGTVEELAHPGLLRRYISGHVETAKALLALVDEGLLDLHVLPQGEMALLIDGQGQGHASLRSRTGVDTFLDPRCGPGSVVASRDGTQLITASGDKLEYRLPAIDCALFSAAAADAEGNVYLTDMATLTETREAVRAARHNDGLVMAVVASLRKADSELPRIEADDIDAIVVNRWNEQSVMAPQSRPWRFLCPGGDGDDRAAAEKLRFINRVLHITPTRDAVDQALARLGAKLFADVVPRGAHVNIGVGYPEEVCREVYASELHHELVFTTETGVYGGMPAPGIYFGGAVNPRRLESSAWMFRHYREHLEAAVLGILEVDSDGNVNVSRRGPLAADYVGPGGFPSIIESASTVIFVGAWMARARWQVDAGQIRLLRPGRPKFVDKVSEVTFNGQRALADGKQVYYVTNIGVFRLAETGLELIWVMPGIDPERDVLPHSGARLNIGQSLKQVDGSVVSGHGFDLHWGRGRGLA
ncbi:MAG: hypothetical protein WBO15_15095 [Gammaproteobacteria bacterium]